MSEPGRIQGRMIGTTELDQIRQLLVAHPNWGRHRLSRHLASLWDWQNPAGQLKDMAARSLLLKLEQRGWIRLPPRRGVAVSRMRPKARPAVPVAESPITEALGTLLPLVLTEVSTPTWAAERRLLEVLLHHHHYLSHRSWVGENLQYLARDAQGRPLACVLFGAAAWQCAARDRYIGWDAPTRPQRLHLIANHSRFLTLPWVCVPHLASYLLSQISRRLSRDWQGKYGHPIYLLESLVQPERFAGTCYQAANWVRVGQTKGRSRQDRPDGAHHQLPRKDIYLYALHSHFRELLQGQETTNNPSPPSDCPQSL